MTIAEAKRRTTLGALIEAVGHHNPKATGIRTVTQVQTNGFWYSCDGIPRGWCTWPAARLTRSIGPDTIMLLLESGKPMSTLTIPKSL
jgi:hypothetical protein